MNKEKFIKRLSDEVRVAMVVNRVSQKDLARKLDLSQPRISGMLQHLERARVEQLLAICDACGVDLLN